MQDIQTCLDRLDALATEVEWVEPGGPGLSGDVLAFVESTLGIQLYDDLKETFKRHNGLFMGIDVYKLEKCLTITLLCREEYTDIKRRKKLKKSLVISGDGTGNPVLISETGQIYVFHHDDTTFEVMGDTYRSIFEKYLENLENHQP